ncbi:MAG: glycosyltransferase, partial [Marinobacter sp.]
EQTLRPSQIVLICDGPLTEALDSIIAKWAAISLVDFVVHRFKNNYGLGYCLHEGLKLCKYDLIARMDADDISFSGRFEKQANFLDSHSDIDIVGSFAIVIDGDGNEKEIRKLPETCQDIISLIWTCPLIHPSVMFRKSTVVQAGSYSKTLKRRQDYDLWFRCAILGARFYNIPEPLIYYRITDSTYGRNSFSVAWTQAIIGYRGCRKLSLGAKAYVGVFYPLLKAILPLTLRKSLESFVRKFDPRERK